MAAKCYFVLRTQDGVVVNTVMCDDEDPSWTSFVEHMTADGFTLTAATTEMATQGVGIGWQLVEGVFKTTTAPLTKEALCEIASATRYDYEVGGCYSPEGVFIATDRKSQSLITGAYNLLKESEITDPEATVDFILGVDNPVTLSRTEFIALALLVGKHVQKCFSVQAQIIKAIQSGEITSPEDISQRFSQALIPQETV